MGTNSLGNEGVEKRLDIVEAKISENTGVITSAFSGLMGRFSELLKQFRILNTHQEILSGERVTKEDVTDG